ncbi:MAG TPA: amidohydrolase family protein [Candidatus Binatus sp.]|nr:amidohydrolase family protein [Candidatus Binatus sp.]
MPRNRAGAVAVAVAFAVLAVSATAQVIVTQQHEKIAIVGATLIDVNNYGHSTNDIAASVVLIDDGKVVAVGSATQITIPPGSTRIDAHGEFLVPGLVDGFGALRTQAFANAYLYEGVTTVYVPTILPNGGGDGELKIVRNASPGPRLFLGAPMTGYSEQGADPSDKPMLDHRLHDRRLSNEQLIARVDQLADQGFRGVTISYDVWPDQVDVIVAESKRRDMAALAEPAFTPYPYAIHAGVSGLPRNDHYLLALAPPAVLLERADNLTASSAPSRAICMIDPASSGVADLGAQLAKSNTALMPTLSMEATADALDVPNPWSARSAALIKAADLDDPVNPSTGESAFLASLTTERRKRVRDCAWHKEAFDARLYQLGAKYLAGSSATSYGIMPGSGLHLELTLLHRIGLSPREAIAAATSNFADIYGWRDIGRIEPGRVADVLILDADPRSDLAALDHIDRIIFRGVVLDRQSLLKARDHELGNPAVRDGR